MFKCTEVQINRIIKKCRSAEERRNKEVQPDTRKYILFKTQRNDIQQCCKEWGLGALWMVPLGIQCQCGIQWATVGYRRVQWGQYDTMWGIQCQCGGEPHQFPACIRPPQKKDSSIVEESNSNGTNRNKIELTEAVVGLKCLHRHLTNYPVYPPNCLLLEWSNVIKQVGTHCRFFPRRHHCNFPAAFWTIKNILLDIHWILYSTSMHFICSAIPCEQQMKQGTS